MRVSEPRCSSVRSSSPIPPIASWCWSSWPRSAIEADVLLEPMRRDSGPAIAAGAAFAQARDGMRSCWRWPPITWSATPRPSSPPAAQGLVAAEAGRIVTFGVSLNGRHRIWLYQPGRAISGEVRAVAKFVEKPDPATAAEYIEAGYLWNSGNFMFRAAVLLDEYRNVDADSVQAVSDAVAKAGTRSRLRHARSGSFGAAKAISIDYAVMEKTSRAAVVPVACGWSDVGSWHAVWELSGKDSAGQCRAGQPRCSRIPATAMSRPTRRWSRWKASTISWWWRRRTPCWCRVRRMPTG